MLIQTAKLSDLKQFHEMFHRFQLHHFKAKSDFFIDPSRITFDTNTYKQLIEDPRRRVLLAKEGKKAVGMLLISIMPIGVGELQYPRTRPTIEMVVVHENYRRHGIAKALIQEAYAWARQQGYSEVVTDVWGFSKKAVELFTAEGFAIRSVRMFKDLE